MTAKANGQLVTLLTTIVSFLTIGLLSFIGYTTWDSSNKLSTLSTKIENMQSNLAETNSRVAFLERELVDTLKSQLDEMKKRVR